MKEYWPIQVKLCIDESISSWLIRTALRNGCDPLILTGIIWPKWRVWTTDVDRHLSQHKINRLLKYLDISPKDIYEAELRNTLKLIYPQKKFPQGIWPWLQGLGVRNRKYRGGLQYCPMCFKQDKDPYYRRSWRFTWVTVCVKHKIRLFDRCFSCKMPLEPHRLEVIRSSFVSICSSCAVDLSNAPNIKIDQNILQFQKLVFSVLKRTKGVILNKQVTVDKWFEFIRLIISIIRRGVLCPNSSEVKLINDSGFIIKGCEKMNLDLQLELLSVITRETIFSNVNHILNNLQKYMNALEEIKHNRCETKRLKSNKINKLRKGPKSMSSVLKSWSRFKRRNRLI